MRKDIERRLAKPVLLMAPAIMSALFALVVHGAQDTSGDTTSSSGGGPLRFVVPFTPGGGSDIAARSISPKLSEFLGRQVIIDNRPGGGITLGSNIVAKSPPDGSTLLIVTIAHAVNPALYRKLPYDTENDFSPVSLVTTGPMVLVVNPNLPAKTLRELITLAKQRPGQLNYGTPGNGSPAHLSAEMLKNMAGIDLMHIPYKGAAGATTDVLAGQIQITFSSISVAPQYVKSGKLRALGVTTTTRARLLPEVPTIAEAGVPGYELVSWQGVLTAGHTSKTIVDKLNAAVVRALNTPEVRDIVTGVGYDATSSTPEEFAALISREIHKWGTLVAKIGARVD